MIFVISENPGFRHIDHPQTAAAEIIQKSLDAGGFSRSLVSVQKDIIGPFAFHKDSGIPYELLLLDVVADELVEGNRIVLLYSLQAPVPEERPVFAQNTAEMYAVIIFQLFYGFRQRIRKFQSFPEMAGSAVFFDRRRQQTDAGPFRIIKLSYNIPVEIRRLRITVRSPCTSISVISSVSPFSALRLK